MTRKQLHAFECFRAAVTHLKEERLLDGPLGPLVRDLEETVSRLSAFAVAQGGARLTRGMAVKQVARLRRALRHEHMIPIARRAKTLLKDLSGVAAAMRVPHARASTEILLAAANAMVKVVQSYVAEFRKAKFDKGFLSRMRADARALREGAAAIAFQSKRRADATAAIPRELRHARETEEAIDGLLLARFDADSSSAAEWRSARRIGAPRGRPRRKRGQGPKP